MSFGLREELAALGLAGPRDPIHDIEFEDVLSGCRGSCVLPTGYAWLERPADEDAGVEEAALAALEDVIGGDRRLAELAALPLRTPSGFALYPRLTTAQMMIDALVPAPGTPQRWPALADDCAELGAFVARLHDRPLDTAHAAALARPDRQMARVRALVTRGRGAPPATLPVERLQEDLLTGFPRLAGALADWTAAPADHGQPVLMHGSLGPSFVIRNSATGEGLLHVIGWLAAGVGPRARDVGWFLGELLELAAAWQQVAPHREAELRTAAGALVRAYVETSARGGDAAFFDALPRFAAAKIVHHVWQTATYVAYDPNAFVHMLSAAELALEEDWLRALDRGAAAA
jgi:hypothetical protein